MSPNVESLQPRNGFRCLGFETADWGGTNGCSVAWRRFGDERVGWFGSLVGRWVVRSTLLYFRLQAATYVLGGGVPTMWAEWVFMANFDHQNHDERVTPGELSVLFVSSFVFRASLC